MDARERRLSLLFVVFLSVKLVEGTFAVDEWPLTNVSMFRDRHPASEVPIRVRLWATTGEGWFELRERDYLLSEDEFKRKLRDSLDVGRACAELIEIYQRKSRPHAQVIDAYAEREEIERPGVPRARKRTRFDCMAGSPGGDRTIAPPPNG